MIKAKGVEEVFANGKAFISYLTAGDPDLATTETLIHAMDRAGADLIMLGLPFSDPVAEGPVIQRASARALAAGTTTDRIFAMIEHARETTAVPLAITTYINPVVRYGADRFLENCARTGVCALIVPDLPFEERAELAPICAAHGVHLISLIAPTSHQRIRAIAREASGFLYCVSPLDDACMRSEIKAEIGEMVRLAKAEQNIPCAVSFGDATPQQVQNIASLADGTIVCSAIVKLVEQYGTASEQPVYDYIKQMKDVLRAL